MNGIYLASCGMDHHIKVWELDQTCAAALSRSYKVRGELQPALESVLIGPTRPLESIHNPLAPPNELNPVMVQSPVASTREIHGNYVDCVRWYGQTILSKSPGDTISLWQFSRQQNKTKSQIDTLAAFTHDDCTMWFMKFDVDLAAGSSHRHHRNSHAVVAGVVVVLACDSSVALAQGCCTLAAPRESCMFGMWMPERVPRLCE